MICDICGKEIDKRAIHLHMRVHEKEKGGVVGEGGKIYDYHVLFPDLACVVRDGSDVYVTPVLALHISAKGGWMIICDKSGNLVRSDAIQECYICSGKKEAMKLLKMLKKSERAERAEKSEGRRGEGLLERLMRGKVRRRGKEEVKRELSERTTMELLFTLKEFARKRGERGGGEEEEDEL